MFDHKAVSSTDKHEKGAIAVIAPPASLFVIIVVLRVMIPSDISTTAKWFGDTFESTVSPNALPAWLVELFGNPAYPLEGNALGLLLTLGVLVLMVGMARAGQWFPGKDMMWTSAMWGLVKREYNASDLNSQKLSLFITTVIVMAADLYTDVLGKTIIPPGTTAEQTVLIYLSACIKLFVITNVLSEMFLFVSAGVFFTSIANLFDDRKAPKFRRPQQSSPPKRGGGGSRTDQRPTRGQEPGRTSPTMVPSYAQQRTSPQASLRQRPSEPAQDRRVPSGGAAPGASKVNFDLDLDSYVN